MFLSILIHFNLQNILFCLLLEILIYKLIFFVYFCWILCLIRIREYFNPFKFGRFRILIVMFSFSFIKQVFLSTSCCSIQVFKQTFLNCFQTPYFNLQNMIFCLLFIVLISKTVFSVYFLNFNL